MEKIESAYFQHLPESAPHTRTPSNSERFRRLILSKILSNARGKHLAFHISDFASKINIHEFYILLYQQILNAKMKNDIAKCELRNAKSYLTLDLSCHKVSIGLAINMEEYVPIVIPIISAKVKSLIESAPNIKSAVRVKSVEREVFIERPSVWLRLISAISAKLSSLP